MPNLLITTSRSTSNRVRTFVRDLWSVHPGSERFNRGGMSLNELIARIGHLGAKAAIVVSMFKGNPRSVKFLLPTGSIAATLILESAVLRREIMPTKAPRINGILGISVEGSSSERTRAVANLFSELLDVPVSERPSPRSIGAEGVGHIELWFSDLPHGKVLWTYFHTSDGNEIGPRMRIAKYER